MIMFAPKYYLYLALIDFYMHIHFLNRVEWLVFFNKFWIPGWLVFWDGGSRLIIFFGFYLCVIMVRQNSLTARFDFLRLGPRRPLRLVGSKLLWAGIEDRPPQTVGKKKTKVRRVHRRLLPVHRRIAAAAIASPSHTPAITRPTSMEHF